MDGYEIGKWYFFDFGNGQTGTWRVEEFVGNIDEFCGCVGCVGGLRLSNGEITCARDGQRLLGVEVADPAKNIKLLKKFFVGVAASGLVGYFAWQLTGQYLYEFWAVCFLGLVSRFLISQMKN